MDKELIEVTEELNREMEKKRRDEIVLAELIKQATELCEKALASDFKKGKKKYKTKVGFLLQGLFGKKKEDGTPIWIIKDLRADQLLQFIQYLSGKGNKVSGCCGAQLEKRYVVVPNYYHQFNPEELENRLAIRNFCSKCGERNIKKS